MTFMTAGAVALHKHAYSWFEVQVFSWFIQILTCVCDDPLSKLKTRVVMDSRTDGWTDGRTDGQTDGQSDCSNPPPTLCSEG